MENLNIENDLVRTTANIRNELSNNQFESIDLINSMINSGSFKIEKHKENGNNNYMDIENDYDHISANSVIKIEVTPDLPCDLETETELRSNVNDFVFEKRKNNDLELGENNLNNLYRCTHCKKQYKTKRSIIKHFKLETCTGELKRNEDDENFIETKKRGPRIIKLADNRYQCRHCEKTYTQKNNLFRHMREDHVKLAKPTCCNVCDKEFYNYQKLHQHLRCHSEKPHECSICCKRFSQVAHFRSHMFTHTSEKPYQCDICERRFNKYFNLKIHIIRHNGEKQFKCRICQTEFFTHGELERHVRIHTEERPYSCDTCGKQFKQNAHLKKHLLSHTGQKPYQCHICERRFSKSFNLKIHLIRHNGEKQFKCRTCQTEFFTHGELEKHVRIHTAERPYSCDLCDKRFKQNAHLKKHLLTHTGQKPYKCTMCEKDYVNSNHLKKHLLTHSGEKLPEHLCPICGNSFSQPSTVKRHIETVHNNFLRCKK